MRMCELHKLMQFVHTHVYPLRRMHESRIKNHESRMKKGLIISMIIIMMIHHHHHQHHHYHHRQRPDQHPGRPDPMIYKTHL